MPGASSALGQQVLSVATAMVGLAAFAVVLALVERVVLETLQKNVERGSAVFESGHVSGGCRACPACCQCRPEGCRSASAHLLAWQQHSWHSVGQDASFLASQATEADVLTPAGPGAGLVRQPA